MMASDTDQALNITTIDPYKISKKSITPKAWEKKLESWGK